MNHEEMLTTESILPTNLNLLDLYDKEAPHIIKYMGSKRTILDFVIKAINENYEQGYLCDLFAGTSILSGTLGRLIPIHSNDIQEYSSVLSNTYLGNYDWKSLPENILDTIVAKATLYVESVRKLHPNLSFEYSDNINLKAFVKLEKQQQKLIKYDFGDLPYHLFIKNYSGTYWSYEQCLWIDGFRSIATEYQHTQLYYPILSSLMYAMSYNSQSTGHYAQYRDATNETSKNDILIYRLKSILPYFKSKFKQLQSHLGKNDFEHRITSLDYRSCLEQIDENTLVYADPPYAFVHYSRFYHALETLIKYDYPKVSHKGRYREDRHQSPFCKRTEVKQAFKDMFTKVKNKNASLILSYSNTGMIGLKEIEDLALQSFGDEYVIFSEEVAYKHSTMGRKDDKSKDVQEYLMTAKKK